MRISGMAMSLVLCLASIACERGDDSSSEQSSKAPPVAAGENATASHLRREHELEGRLVSIDPATREVVIEHDSVPSLELTSDRTQFLVTKTADVEGLQSGEQVHFVLVRDNYGRYVIREIWQE